MCGQIFSFKTVNIRGRTVFDETRMPRSLYRERLNKIKEHMRGKGLDALIIAGQAHYCENLTYVSGLLLGIWGGPGRAGYCLITADKEPILINVSGPREIPFYKALTWISDIRVMPGGVLAVANIIKGQPSLKKVGLVGISPSINSGDYALLKKELGQIEFTDETPFFENMRKIKDEREFDIIRLSCKAIDVECETLSQTIAEGVAIREAEAEADRIARLEGARDVRILWATQDMRVLSLPLERTFKAGDIVACYFATEVLGYWAEAGRVFTIGKPSDEYTKMYNAGLKALSAGENAIKAGSSVSSVYKQMIDELKSSGYEENFVAEYGFGHGIGLSIAEKPFIEENADVTLEENMAISIRVPLYKSGVGFVLVGETVKVLRDGVEKLSKYPTEITTLG